MTWDEYLDEENVKLNLLFKKKREWKNSVLKESLIKARQRIWQMRTYPWRFIKVI